MKGLEVFAGCFPEGRNIAVASHAREERLPFRGAFTGGRGTRSVRSLQHIRYLCPYLPEFPVSRLALEEMQGTDEDDGEGCKEDEKKTKAPQDLSFPVKEAPCHPEDDDRYEGKAFRAGEGGQPGKATGKDDENPFPSLYPLPCRPEGRQRTAPEERLPEDVRGILDKTRAQYEKYRCHNGDP